MKKILWLALLAGAVFLIIHSFLNGIFLHTDLEIYWRTVLSRVIFLFASFLLIVLFHLVDMNVSFMGAALLFLGALMNFLEVFFLFPDSFYLVKFIFYLAGSFLIFFETFKVMLRLKRLTLMFRGLFNENNDMVIFYDVNGKIVEVNPATEKFLKYTKEELIGKTIEDISSSDETVTLRMMSLSYPESSVEPLEREFVSKDGEIVPCESKLIPIYEGKTVVLIQEIARPISEIRKIEDQIRRERQRFLTYFNNIPVLSIILREDGTVEDINEAGCRLLKTDRKDLLNRNWFELFPESFPKDLFEKAFKEKVMHEGIIRDGGERIVRWVFIPLEENRLMVAGIDITEERRNLLSLEKDRKFYHLLLNLSGSLLSLGWSDYVFKQYLPLIAEVFDAEDVAFYEKEDGKYHLRVSLGSSFEESLSDVPKTITCENGVLKIPLEHETETFAFFLITCREPDRDFLEMAKLLKNQLELVYWKLKGEERILWLAEHDPLTGVYNREAFESRLVYLMNLSKRYNRKLSFIFIDLDDFKHINDSKGHLVGDRVLKEFARTLSTLLRKSDIVGRLGGDEFGIVLPETDFNGAEAMIRRIEDRFREPVVVDEDRFLVKFSYGISVFPDDGESIEELMKVADERMYINKFRKKEEKDDG
ncbi:diguanylate cyclase domain-containing protein [Thermotoga neapolitana]|uniref:PleD-related protein n=1 Tax=Thermotoga neapolitana (strain ATCC 49049 / DSM 4359 / NBRC 107923 / NS-E) TaxID=309803 RepID=B9K9D5_THENN|nr:diguanylate cyclase [Thermotoga neapolitana]ACM23568.1 PleD-related protein [Thermotoga neapolitana DSM 4359]KFZ21196.1 PleD-related protein [Thermotoga neapolitana LA10]HBF10333.1 GGDEF domain-containing protein [Thermotoga neapolitana]